MRKTFVTGFTLLSALSLAACDAAPEAQDEAAADAEFVEGMTLEPESATGDAADTSDGNAAAAPDGDAEAIPVALRGRWGLTANDCDPSRSDNKGLLTVSADRLEFYESVGELGNIEEARAARIRADFAFTGEGMSWERDMALEVQDGGETLIRREYGDDAAPDPFRYSKCA